MKRLTTGLFLWVLTCVSGFPVLSDQETPSPGMILLKSGDHISSGIRGVVPGGFLVEFPWSAQPFTIKFEDVKWYVRPDVTHSPLEKGVVLRLTNGDQITGTDLKRDPGGDWLFTTHWGQTLSVTPDQVERIRFYPEGRLKMAGPMSGKNWGSHALRRIPGTNQRTRRPVYGGRSVLHSRQPSMVIPSVPLPDPFLLEIEYTFAAEPSNTRFTLFQNSGRMRSGQFNMTLNRDRLSANWFEFDEKKPNRRKGKNWNENVSYVPGLQRLQVSGGSASGKLFVNLNDVMKKEFPFPAVRQENFFDTFTMTLSQNHSESLVISGVRLIGMGQQRKLPSGLPDKGKRRLITYDGRIEEGEVVSLTETDLEWRKASDGESMLVPRAKIFELAQADSDEKEPIEPTATPQHHLFTGIAGDRFALKVTDLEGDVVVGTSPFTTDSIRIPLSQIQFWKMDGTHALEVTP